MLIISSGQEAKIRSGGKNRDILSLFFNMKVNCEFSLVSPHLGDSNEYTKYTIFSIKKDIHPKLSQICNYGIFFEGTPERVRNNRDKRAISVRAIEVLPYNETNFKQEDQRGYVLRVCDFLSVAKSV